MGYANEIVSGTVIGRHGPTVELNNTPTLVVSRSTGEPATKSLNLTGIQAVNFIAGVKAVIQSATLTNGPVLFVNTQPGVVTLQLDNGGTVGGQAIYVLAFGTPVMFSLANGNLS